MPRRQQKHKPLYPRVVHPISSDVSTRVEDRAMVQDATSITATTQLSLSVVHPKDSDVSNKIENRAGVETVTIQQSIAPITDVVLAAYSCCSASISGFSASTVSATIMLQASSPLNPSTPLTLSSNSSYQVTKSSSLITLLFAPESNKPLIGHPQVGTVKYARPETFDI